MASRACPASPSLHRLGHEPAGGDGLLDELQQFRHFKRLEQIIVSAGLRGFDGGFGGAVRGHHHDRQPRLGGVQFAHQFQPVQAGQFQIGDDHVKTSFLGAGQAGVAGCLNRHFIAFVGQHAAQSGHDGGIVLDQQDFCGRIHGLCSGKNNAKGGAVIGLGLILERTVMFFNNARRDGQAEAGARILGREKRVEQPLFSLGRNAFAGVGDLQNHHVRSAGRSAVFHRAARAGSRCRFRRCCRRRSGPG